MSQIANLHVPLSEEEERLVASIPSHIIPIALDDELDRCLSKYSKRFWSNRTIDELRECWFHLRQQGRLTDQPNAFDSKRVETIQESRAANKLSELLIPVEFELLTRNKEEFLDKTDFPHALFQVNDRLYCMYSEQLTFGTSFPNEKFDISVVNSTTIHIKGFILRRSGAFYIINNGDNPFRVNDALLNPNEASPLGTRAIINNMTEKRALSPPPLPTFVLRSFSSGVCCVKYDLADSLRLYTGEQQGSIHLYDLRTRLPILSLTNAHSSTVLSLSQLSEDNQLISSGKDGFIKIWNANGQCQWDYQTYHCSFSNCDTISPNLIVTPIGSDDSLVGALDCRCTDPVIKKFQPISPDINNGMVMKLRVFDNRWLFVAYENGSVKVFDIASTKQIDSYQVTSDHEPITALDVACNTCLCGTTKSDLISLDFASLKLEKTSTFRQVELPNAGTSSLRCRPNDGKLIAVAGWDSRLRLFRRETGKQLAMLDHHRQQINSIDFDFHTRQMACASEDRTVSIWDIYNNKT
ncbi:unnamed protein product [Adineta ricciae]|uniref:Uncharacterized protein n=2 Tax=Adineta ricciae TaxID=249248 RepID=A0A814ABZ3_ADIRI|nr:unnamed protein product [Adineta ricciae]